MGLKWSLITTSITTTTSLTIQMMSATIPSITMILTLTDMAAAGMSQVFTTLMFNSRLISTGTGRITLNQQITITTTIATIPTVLTVLTLHLITRTLVVQAITQIAPLLIVPRQLLQATAAAGTILTMKRA